MILIYLFVLVVILKFVINLSRYIQLRYYFRMYEQYLKNPDWTIAQHRPQIIKLFTGAGVEDTKIPHVALAEYGYVLPTSVSVFSNMSNTRGDIVSLVTSRFHEAIGVYRSRMIDAINPLYWLEFIVFLPRHVMEYLEVPAESRVIKLIEVVWWLAASVVGLLMIVYEAEIQEIGKRWINQLLK